MSADFVERKKFEQSDINDNASLHKFIDLTVDDMKAKGATFFRVCHPTEDRYDIYVEGWKTRPEDQGPYPWEK